MKKIYTVLLAGFMLATWNNTASAQCNGAPCPSPIPEPNAQDACILPNPDALDCYFGATFPSVPVSFPPTWCTTIENNHFFAFTADAITASFEMCTYGCAAGGAIQAAVLSTANCVDFDFVSPCLGNISSGSCQTLVADNLVPGEVYYLMIDGSAGALCDYSINGVNPTINGPTSAPCLPSTQLSTYTTNTTSDWTITPPSAGQIQGSASGVTSVSIQWLEAGPASVCAMSNVCPNAPNLCIDIFIGEDVESTEEVQVCQGYQVQCAGQNFSNNGTFPVTLNSYLGCDSVVNCVVNVIPTVFTTVNVKMCPGGSVECAGEEFFQTGSFNVTLEAFQGCDSVVRCVVSLIPIPNMPMQNINLCGPATFPVCDDVLTETGLYAQVCTGYLGCDSIVNINLAIMEPVAVIAPPAIIDCGANQTVTLNGTASNVNTAQGGITTYKWTGPGIVGFNNQPSVTVNLPGEYCLILTHGRGGVNCSDTACVTVLASALPPGATATGGNINCIANQTTLMGGSGTSGVTYTWSGPGINQGNQFLQNPTVDQLGVYVLTVFDPSNSCSSTATVTVNGDTTPPTASAVGDTITCLQTSITIDGITNAVTATWNWSGPGINPGNQMVENPNVLVSGTYNVTVTNTVNGCTNTASTVVDINNSNPTATAGPNDTLTCTQPNLTLQGAGNAGGQPITFAWTGPNGFMSNVAQPNVNVDGTYILTVLNTLNGCLKMDTVNITSNQLPPTALAGADSTINCVQPSVFLIGSASSNGANFTASWSGPGINASNMNLYNPEVDQPGDYTLVITNITNGCTDTDTVVVNLNTALPTAIAGADQQLTCSNPNGVTLSGSGVPASVTYFWTGPGIGSNNETEQNPLVTQPGPYDLIVTNPVNGCTATDQVIVTQDANVPTADGGPDLVLNCSVTSVDIDGSGSTSGPGVIYNWSGPGISGNNVTAQSPTGLNVSGTYNVTVTNTNNNCENTDVVVILIDTIQPIADAGNPLVLNCSNNTTGTLDASGSSLGSNYTLLWSGNGINPGNENQVNPVINQDGLYTLIITDTDNNCTATDQVNVALDVNPPTADAGVDQTIDCIVTSTVIGGNSSTGPNFTYLWTGPGIDASNQSLPTPTIDEPGNYNLVVTNTINGCTATSDVLINTNAVLPTALAGNDGLLTCANPTAVLDGSGSTSGPNFQVLWTGPGINAGNQNQPMPSVTIQGTYVIQITNTQNSCIETDTVVVGENKAIPAADAGQNRILNCQILSVSLDGSLSGVSPTIVYNWTGPGINGGNQNSQNPSINQPGTYDLVVLDNNNGCSATDQVLVTQDTVAPAASAGPDGLITCALPTETIDGSGSSVGPNITYLWLGPGINSNNVQQQSPTVNVSGTYTVTVTNTQNKCTSTDVVFVAVDKTPPVIAAGPDQTLTCTAQTAQLDATQSASGPNISFLWGGPGILPGNQTSSTPTVNLPGTYLLTVTDANNGCTSSESVMVGIDTISPIVLAGNNLIITCANSATGVTFNSTGSSIGSNFDYLWTGPGITPTNENTPNPTVLLPGTYTLQITNTTNGCDNTDVVIVDSEQDLPTADAGAPQVITCAITSVNLDASGSSSPNNGSLTYFWSGPGINAVNEDDEMPLVLLSGTYFLTVTNVSTGCSASDQVLVSLDNMPPTSVATSEIITCLDQVSTVTANSSLTGSSFLWTGPDVSPINEADQTIQVDLTGVYTVTVTAPNGCTTTASTTVTQDADVPQGIASGAVLNCINSGTAPISGEVISPTGATFNWTGPGIVGTATTSSVMVSQAGTYTFSIIAPNGCIRQITTEVLADFVQPTVVIANPADIDCNTTEITINASASSSGPNYTITWSTPNGNFVSGTNTLNPVVDQAGDYQLVIVNNTNGCSKTNQVDVMVDPKVPTGFDLAVRNIKCFGEVNGSITVNGVQGGTSPFIFFLSGNTGSPNNQYTGLAAGQYTISLEDANGCELDTTITITEPGELLVELGPDIRVSLGEFATVTSQIETTVGIESVVWNYTPNCTDSIPYCETFTYQPFDTYRHRITVKDLNGCIARDEVLVIVKKARQVYVPNIFNPDSEENYVVTVFGGIDVAKINSFFIFDRWGEEVFQAVDFMPNDYSKGWDGTVRGQDGHLGVYVWYCEVEFIDGETVLFKGDVTLIR